MLTKKNEKETGYFKKLLNKKKYFNDFKYFIFYRFNLKSIILWFIILYYFISVTSIADGAKVPKKSFVKYPNNRYQTNNLNQLDFSGNGK
jgi:hypothetical protein